MIRLLSAGGKSSHIVTDEAVGIGGKDEALHVDMMSQKHRVALLFQQALSELQRVPAHLAETRHRSLHGCGWIECLWV
jgi:hypothetical protein